MKYTIYTRDGETIKTKDPDIGTVFIDCQPECLSNYRYLIPVINIARITYEVKENKQRFNLDDLFKDSQVGGVDNIKGE